MVSTSTRESAAPRWAIAPAGLLRTPSSRAALQAGGHTGRELLRRCLGGDVQVSLDDTGRHLIAAVGLNLLALSPFAQDGSGGALPTQATRLILAA